MRVAKHKKNNITWKSIQEYSLHRSGYMKGCGAPYVIAQCKKQCWIIFMFEPVTLAQDYCSLLQKCYWLIMLQWENVQGYYGKLRLGRVIITDVDSKTIQDNTISRGYFVYQHHFTDVARYRSNKLFECTLQASASLNSGCSKNDALENILQHALLCCFWYYEQ